MVPAVATKKCPVCGTPVKVENLERHVKNQHPHTDVAAETLVTKEERRDVERKTSVRRRQKVTSGGIRIVAVTVVIVAIVLLLIVFVPFRGSIGIGDTAPDFAMSTTSGGEVRLSNLRGTVVFLEFMDVDCEFCIAEAQDVLPQLYRDYQSRGVRFLSIDVNFVGQADNAQRINQFKAKYGTPWDYMLDTGRTTAAYGVSGTPTTFILDRGGVVVEVVKGRAANGYATYAAGLDRALS